MSDVTGAAPSPESAPPPAAAVHAPPPPPPAAAVVVAPAAAGPVVATGPARAAHRRVGKTRHPWGVWALTIVTLGIYGIVWYFKINKEVRDFEPNVVVSPGVSVLALLFGWVLFGIPTIVSVVKSGSRIARAQQAGGIPARCSGLVGLLLWILGFGTVYYQSELNKVWAQFGSPPEGTPV